MSRKSLASTLAMLVALGGDIPSVKYALRTRHAWVGKKIRGQFDFYCVPV